MARYRLDLKYDGSPFSGWQRQNNAITVQQVVEEALSKKLQDEIKVVGCGRTDTGVHASHYVMHFDSLQIIDETFIFGLNNLLPKEVAIDSLINVKDDFHARFDAVKRSYVYKVHTRKNPFLEKRSFYYHRFENINRSEIDAVASMILKYKEFGPFCKAHTDVNTMRCDVSEAYWIQGKSGDQFEFHISADRFLRGMVRLIVGASIQAGLGIVSSKEIEESLKNQSELPKAWSVPSHGLYLRAIEY